MHYLFHAVPKNLQGSILYPLNALKEIYPKVYEQQVNKYIGREHITQQRIPILNCLWNDVLHFSAVNPKEIKQALIEAGNNTALPMSFYQVDPTLLDPKNSIVYLYGPTEINDKLREDNFVKYNPEEVEKFSSMPQATRDYFKEMISEGERPLLYHRIPHILYKGTLETKALPIISI